jgi:hypothetical protein
VSALLKAPWQVGLAVAAVFVDAGVNFILALYDLFLFSAEESLILARQESIASQNPDFDHILGQAAFSQASAVAYFTVSTALLVMGLFLAAGAFRGGVLGVLTVTMGVLVVGGFMALLGTNGYNHVAVIQAGIVHTLTFVFVLLVWGRSGRKWIALGTNKKWDQS